MSSLFDDVIGHETIVRLLSSYVLHPAPAYLLFGPPGAGKRKIAERFIGALLGSGQIRIHPDFILLDVLEGKKQISVEQVRELRERISMRPMIAPRVVVYLPHAGRLNESGMNALLTVLEEPPAGAVFVLVAEDVSRIPATVLSRVVQIPFLATASGDAVSVFASAFFAAQTLGARLRVIEDLAKSCDANEDPERAWQETLGAAMREWRGEGMIFGIALVAARRLIGSSVSPRVALEAGAVRMSGDADREARRLMPTHVPRTLPLLF